MLCIDSSIFTDFNAFFFFIYNYIWTKGSNCYIKINQLNFCMIDDIPVVGRYVYLCLLGFSINCQTKLTSDIFSLIWCIVYCHSTITNSLCTSARCCIYTAYFPALVEYFQCQWMINRQSWRTRPISNCTLITLDL